MNNTTIDGKLECSSFHTVMYEERFQGPGVLILGDSLYHALCDATGEGPPFGAPHVIRGQAKLSGQFVSSPFREYSLVLYNLNSYSFFPLGSQTELSGTLPKRSTIEVELWADGHFPLVRFPGQPLPAMAVDVDTIRDLQRRVREVAKANDDEIRRRLFRKIQWLNDEAEAGMKRAGDLKEYCDPQEGK